MEKKITNNRDNRIESDININVIISYTGCFTMNDTKVSCYFTGWEARHGILRERASVARGRFVPDCGRICGIN